MTLLLPRRRCCCPTEAAPPCEPITSVTINPAPPGPYPGPQLLAVTPDDGTAPYTYQWFQAPAILLPGETNPTYLANPIFLSDFYCVVDNACSSQPSPAVSVQPPD